MKRRKFLWVTTVASSLVILYPVSSCDSRQKLNHSAAIPLTLGHLTSSENISKIGIIYRNLYLKEDESYLEDQLINDMNLSKKEIINSISEKINQDFIKENILIIDGWVLSKTEAQQCALYSIKNK